MSIRNSVLGALGAALIALVAVSSLAAENPTTQHEHKMPMGSQSMPIDRQAETAKSAQDHEALAKRFEDQAAQLEHEASAHDRLAKHYRRGVGVGPKTNAKSLAIHCERLVKSLRASAEEAREMAQLHRDVGKQMSR